MQGTGNIAQLCKGMSLSYIARDTSVLSVHDTRKHRNNTTSLVKIKHENKHSNHAQVKTVKMTCWSRVHLKNNNPNLWVLLFIVLDIGFVCFLFSRKGFFVVVLEHTFRPGWL